MASNEVARGLRRPTPSSYGSGGVGSASGAKDLRATTRPTGIHARGGIDEQKDQPQFQPAGQRPERADIAATALQGVLAVDLAPLASTSTDHMIAQLTRIEYLVGQQAENASGPDAQSFTIGLAMVSETIRRLRLVQSAGDRLVVGGS